MANLLYALNMLTPDNVRTADSQKKIGNTWARTHDIELFQAQA